MTSEHPRAMFAKHTLAFIAAVTAGSIVSPAFHESKLMPNPYSRLPTRFAFFLVRAMGNITLPPKPRSAKGPLSLHAITSLAAARLL
jgi:hypothetical protein